MRIIKTTTTITRNDNTGGNVNNKGRTTTTTKTKTTNDVEHTISPIKLLKQEKIYTRNNIEFRMTTTT